MQVTAAGIAINQLPLGCLSFDIAFDNHRVWTVETHELPSSPTPSFLKWPASLLAQLVGHTSVTITDSASNTVIFRGDVQFTAEPVRTLVTNKQGIPLAINKWGHLAPALSGLPPETLKLLLKSTENLITELQNLGFRPFIVGGTLLGAVREGRLLPHDDDADIAYLSHHTHPADIAAESFALGHMLTAKGYEFIRHSAAHIQFIFRTDDGHISYHIDIFSAFFTDDGMINQPFHVRGQFHQDQMLPFGAITIGGHEFPTPADTDAWLSLNYDENWRTPIPGYRLHTPNATVRRFDSWFGWFNFRREFWDEWFENNESNLGTWTTGSEWLAVQELESPTLIELGSGYGQLSKRLATAQPSMRVIGTDFSTVALDLARDSHLVPNLEFRRVNLNRLESLGSIADVAATGPFDIVANHVLEQIGQQARWNALRLIRMALRSGGQAYATSYAMHAADVTIDDPTTWHLRRDALRLEASQLGLDTVFESVASSPDEANRKPFGVKFFISQTPLNSRSTAPEKGTMKIRLKAFIRRATNSTLQIEVDRLKSQVETLEGELDECRRQSLRVAEMLDLVEQRLTFQTPIAPTE